MAAVKLKVKTLAEIRHVIATKLQSPYRAEIRHVVSLLQWLFIWPEQETDFGTQLSNAF